MVENVVQSWHHKFVDVIPLSKPSLGTSTLGSPMLKKNWSWPTAALSLTHRWYSPIYSSMLLSRCRVFLRCTWCLGVGLALGTPWWSSHLSSIWCQTSSIHYSRFTNMWQWVLNFIQKHSTLWACFATLKKQGRYYPLLQTESCRAWTVATQNIQEYTLPTSQGF